MKKSNNTIKFWVLNRFTYLFIAWVCLFILMGIVNDVYFNAFILTIGGFLTLCAWAYIVEDNHANSSERLMWSKLSSLLDAND